MTARQRLLAVLHGETPDCIPVCPDISNMVPCRLTGKPSWEIYVHQDPPLWKAHIDAIKRFDLDGGFELYDFGDLFGDQTPSWTARIVARRAGGSFVTQGFCAETGERSKYVTHRQSCCEEALRMWLPPARRRLTQRGKQAASSSRPATSAAATRPKRTSSR